MKKILVVVSFLAFIITSCETDFDVNSDWEEITVVYGLLNPNNDTQYVRINKAFLGDADAVAMASISDSINYDPSNLSVSLHKINFNDTVSSVNLDTSLVIKDSLDVNGTTGLFPVDNNIIYNTVLPTGFLNKNFRYALTIDNSYSGHKVSSNTEVISDFSFLNFNPAYKFGFYNPNLSDSSKFLSKSIEWEKVTNGEIYQLDIKFNYLENNVVKSIIWSQPLEVFDGRDMTQRLEGIRFFNFLERELSNENVTRVFIGLDLIMNVGTKNLNTYIKVNEPITGIVSQRPQFTNINNGIGIFSSRFTHTEYNIGLTDDTRNYLINNLNRNFQ